MNDDAESSHLAGLRHVESELDPEPAQQDQEEEARERKKLVKQRRQDAKRKRIAFLDHLLRELDSLVFVELITLYYLDCSFFWFTIRAIVHVSMLTPLPDLQLARQHDEHKPFLPLITCLFVVNFLLHTISRAPSAGEDTRGYLHGGLMIDFIGQQGPTSKWKLAGLDLCILLLQLVMVSVHVKKRDLKKKLAKIAGGGTSTREPAATEGESEAESPEAIDTEQQPNTTTSDDRDQDADAEERGMLRRTDTLSDAGAEQDEEDALLPSSSESGHVDALDRLSSGQCVVGDFSLIDTLLEENERYQSYRETRADGSSSSSSLSPTALRQLHAIRVRFGVGGG
ncbi:DUF1746-domain-containing protein [Lophiostoma macrostomum CBS 122681]|uniref:DUF1746-domain-containing protein n=1 Tax=Lophiostoma macrostomum CBS 122681 TaxID=1314788 RepID=A0A6A6T3R7_9PLEO|nr:DUF1746-domain-containing protein [Lophiostoma macrostomum CBS 122681]